MSSSVQMMIVRGKIKSDNNKIGEDNRVEEWCFRIKRDIAGNNIIE